MQSTAYLPINVAKNRLIVPKQAIPRQLSYLRITFKLGHLCKIRSELIILCASIAPHQLSSENLL